MAYWALGMLIATGLGVGVTFVGVIYVKWTLELNRELLKAAEQTAIDSQNATRASTTAALAAVEANRVNRENALASRRPWVSVAVELKSMGLTDERRCFQVDFKLTLKNFGQSPAMKLVPHHEIVRTAGPEEAYNPADCQAFEQRLRRRDASLGSVVFPDQPWSINTGVVIHTTDTMRKKDRNQLYLITGTRYEDTSGGSLFITTQMVDLGGIHDDGLTIVAGRTSHVIVSYAD